jgi:hypothetical protein
LPAKPDPLLAQAQALVAAAFDPAKTSLEAQRQQALAEAAARQQAIQGFAQAGAEQVAPIGGQVQAGYQDAAARTAQYSKGFSIGQQMAQTQSAEDINAFLAKNGSPQGQMVNPNNGAPDVLYGTTGFIPASGLEREGAAFGAAARMLPATMLGRGQQLQYESQRESQKTDKEYLAELSKIEAERPGAVQKALLELKDAALKERAQRVDEQIAIEKLGISKANLDLRAAELEARLKQKKGVKKFSTAQIIKFNEDAWAIASDAFADVGKDPNGYQVAIREMLGRKIPLSIAQSALNKLWTKPGVGGRPYVKFQNRRAKPKKKP